MCSSGVCEGGCPTEVSDKCPVVLGMLANLDVPVKKAVESTADMLPKIIRAVGNGESGTAAGFFNTGWTAR